MDALVPESADVTPSISASRNVMILKSRLIVPFIRQLCCQLNQRPNCVYPDRRALIVAFWMTSADHLAAGDSPWPGSTPTIIWSPITVVSCRAA
jgi:hypothetical protein